MLSRMPQARAVLQTGSFFATQQFSLRVFHGRGLSEGLRPSGGLSGFSKSDIRRSLRKRKSVSRAPFQMPYSDGPQMPMTQSHPAALGMIGPPRPRCMGSAAMKIL